jgi:preprotein translocase subunit Sec63
MTTAEASQILGVQDDASSEELKRAYREKARLYHPDVNSGQQATSDMAQVNLAYEVLSGCTLLDSAVVASFPDLFGSGLDDFKPSPKKTIDKQPTMF